MARAGGRRGAHYLLVKSRAKGSPLAGYTTRKGASVMRADRESYEAGLRAGGKVLADAVRAQRRSLGLDDDG